MTARQNARSRISSALERVPLLVPAAGFTAGATVEVAWGVSWWIMLGVAAVIGPLFFLLRWRCGVWGVVAAAIGAAIAWPVAHASLPQSLVDRSASYVATVQSVRVGHSGVTIECRIDSADGAAVAGRPKASVTLLSQERVPWPGQIIRFTTQLEVPHAQTELPDELDYSAFRRSRGIVAQGLLPRDSLTDVYGAPDRSARIRADIEERIMRLPLQPDTRAFLGAVIAGSDELIQPDVRTCLADAGVAHVLALSGLHVGIIAMIFGALFFPLQMAGHRKLRIACIIASIWIFAVVTGCADSVLRAAVMATVLLVGRMLERDSSPLNALCAAAIIVVAIWPGAVLSMGAQMSFAAAASIVLFMPAVYALNLRQRFVGAVLGYVGASCAAMLSAGVVSVFYFHKFPVYFLLGNIVAAILLAPLLCLGILDIIVSSFVQLPPLLASASDAVYSMIYYSSSAVASMPGATVDNAYFSGWLLVPMAVTWLALVLAARLRDRRFVLAAATMILITVACFCISRPHYPGNEAFLTANLRHTTIVERRGDTLRLVTAAAPQHHREVEARARTLYADYCGRRGISTIIVATDPVVRIAGRQYALINGRYAFPDSTAGISVAVVSAGYKGKIDELIETVRPDTIVLGRDLNRRRANRYRSECEALGMPVLML